ncbi:MAG: ABC transporter permease [Clostridiales bacterium]
MKEILLFSKNNKLFSVLVIFLSIILLVTIFAPFIIPYNPFEAHLENAFKAPNGDHWFGTDKLGRDVFSRVIYGTRISLSAALILVSAVFVIGSTLGIIAGYFGKAVDDVIMRISDMMISFPGMVLAIAVAGILGASIVNAMIALMVVSWTKYARLARSLVLKIRHKDYVCAAEVLGSKTGHILTHHMLPNVLHTLIITATMDLGTMILELAGLSFLGFGAQPPMPEWGLMLNEGRSYMLTAPWLMIFPGLAICFVVVIFNLFGDSLRDILDPKDE